MAELLDSIRTEIRERLEAARPAAEEYERLEAALDALGGPIAITAMPAPVPEEPEASQLAA